MGPWATEWIALPQACILAASVTGKLAWILEGLSIDEARMRANLDLTRGGILAEELMMRLGRTLGHEAAHELVGRAARRAAESGASLDVELEGDVALAAPEDYVGWSVATSQESAARIRSYLASLAT
jgi:3-carboxy-cis,cis-muconate cycloisomerase